MPALATEIDGLPETPDPIKPTGAQPYRTPCPPDLRRPMRSHRVAVFSRREAAHTPANSLHQPSQRRQAASPCTQRQETPAARPARGGTSPPEQSARSGSANSGRPTRTRTALSAGLKATDRGSSRSRTDSEARPRGRDAARAAIKSLPQRIDTSDEMFEAFKTANGAAAELAPRRLRCSRREAHRCPASTLCAAAWTPSGGLLVGIAGDTRPVLLRRDDESWSARSLGRLHRNISIHGNVTKYLGAPGIWPAMGADDRNPMDIFTDDNIDLPAEPTAIAVVIVSDGAWEPLVRDVYAGTAKQADPVGKAIAACVTPDDRDAQTIATRIVTAARTAGLDDNATVAVAAVNPAVR